MRPLPLVFGSRFWFRATYAVPLLLGLSVASCRGQAQEAHSASPVRSGAAYAVLLPDSLTAPSLVEGGKSAQPSLKPRSSITLGSKAPQMFLNLGHDNAVRVIAYSPDGKTIASGGFGKEIRLWEAKSGELKAVLSLQSHWVNALAFSPDGKTLAGALYPDTIQLWDSRTGVILQTLKHPYMHWNNGVSGLAWAPDSSWLASCGDNGVIKMWEPKSGRLLRDIPTLSKSLDHLVASPDGRTLLGHSRYEGRAYLWDVQRGQYLAALRYDSPQKGDIEDIDWSKDGQTIVLAGSTRSQDNLTTSGCIQIYDALRGTLRRTILTQYTATEVHLSPDGQLLAVKQGDKPGLLLSASSGATLAVLPSLRDNDNNSYALAFSPDGRQLAVAYRLEEMTAWNVRALVGAAAQPESKPVAAAAPEPLAQLPPKALAWMVGTRSDNWVVAAALVARGQRLLVATYGGQIYQWDTASARLLNSFSISTGKPFFIPNTAFSPDGKLLVTQDMGSALQVWDIGSGKLVKELSSAGANNGYAGYTLDIVFSPDGRTLAASTGDAVQLWEVESWKSILNLRATGPVLFSPDSQWLAVRSLKTRLLGLHTQPQFQTQVSGKIDLVKVKGDDYKQIGPGKDLPFGEDFYTRDAARLEAVIKANEGAMGTEEIAFAPDSESLVLRSVPYQREVWKSWEQRLAQTTPDPPPTPIITRWSTKSGQMMEQLSVEQSASLFDPPRFGPEGRTRWLAKRNSANDRVEWIDTRTHQSVLTLQLLPSETDFVIAPPTSAEAGKETSKEPKTANESNTASPKEHPAPLPSPWILFSPQGYYLASPGAEKYIRWRVVSKSFPASRYAARFNRPDLMINLLQRESADAFATRKGTAR